MCARYCGELLGVSSSNRSSTNRRNIRDTGASTQESADPMLYLGLRPKLLATAGSLYSPRSALIPNGNGALQFQLASVGSMAAQERECSARARRLVERGGDICRKNEATPPVCGGNTHTSEEISKPPRQLNKRTCIGVVALVHGVSDGERFYDLECSNKVSQLTKCT